MWWSNELKEGLAMQRQFEQTSDRVSAQNPCNKLDNFPCIQPLISTGESIFFAAFAYYYWFHISVAAVMAVP
jgi:hypothetical protein